MERSFDKRQKERGQSQQIPAIASQSVTYESPLKIHIGSK
jgi:hypothetical protein